MPTFDMRDVVVSYNGVILGGWAPDQAVSIEFDEDFYSLSVGADGEAVRSRSNVRSATITLRFQRTSPSNITLDAAQKADDANNAGAVPFTCLDKRTGTLYASEAAWVQKPPNEDLQQEAQPKEWTLRAGEMDVVHGASTEVP